MITFFAFLLTIAGCINWLMIGLLQYDFVAGMFGYQASIFSRLCYILVGVAALYFVLRVIINKGTCKVLERKKRKDLQIHQPAPSNIDASQEGLSANNSSLFDQHLKNE